jgi:hypothetical protein
MDLNHRRGEMAQLGAILAREVETRGWHRASWGWIVHRSWSTVVGSYLAEHSRLISIDDDGLTIAVPTSAWAQELGYWKPEILRRLGELAPGSPVPETIRIRVVPRLFASKRQLSHAIAERGSSQPSHAPAQTDLQTLFQSVKDKHAAAVEHWLKGEYTRCARCQSPTLRGYRLCATCEYRTGR